MKTIFTFLFICLLSVNIFAQEQTRVVPFQITLFPPIGTNGIYAGSTINKVSFNVFAGYAAGLDGVEFGGFANINRSSTTGAQFAGFANISGGEVNGVQFSGFANINADETFGLQFAGFSNINAYNTDGVQAAGFMNFTREDSRVIQLAGFGNFAHNVKGLQVAGFGNFSSGNIEGVQVSGFINAARTVNGFQIGFLNIADSVKTGIPIGFLSIVRNGFHQFEFGISEGLNSYASFKIGVDQFYNIFSVGMQYLSDDFRWGFGYGIGTHLKNTEDFKINLEAMTYHIDEGGRWTHEYNDLQQFKLTFARSMGENTSIFAGPVINLMVSDYYENGNLHTGSGFAPYHITNGWHKKTNIKTWIGFSAGIRIQ